MWLIPFHFIFVNYIYLHFKTHLFAPAQTEVKKYYFLLKTIIYQYVMPKYSFTSQ